MPIPKEHDIGGWYIPDHAVKRFRERYGWADESDTKVRYVIRDTLQQVGPEGVYEFYSTQNEKNMHIYHCVFGGVHSYFLVNPQQRPPAVVSVFTLGQFRNFWDQLPEEYRLKGPEQEFSETQSLAELEQKELEVIELKKKLEEEQKKTHSSNRLLKQLKNSIQRIIEWTDEIE